MQYLLGFVWLASLACRFDVWRLTVIILIFGYDVICLFSVLFLLVFNKAL